MTARKQDQISFRDFGKRTCAGIARFLKYDATAAKLDKIIATCKRGEIFTNEDQRVVLRLAIELRDLSERISKYQKKLDRKIAKLPEETQAVIREERERLR